MPSYTYQAKPVCQAIRRHPPTLSKTGQADRTAANQMGPFVVVVDGETARQRTGEASVTTTTTMTDDHDHDHDDDAFNSS